MPDSGESFDLLSPERTHPIIYTLLANKMTTRSELRVLTIDEVLDLYEVCIVSIYSKNKILGGGAK